MKSKSPLKTYQQRRKARILTSARIESMEQTISSMSLGQGHRHTHDFATVRAAVKAVEEVSVGFVHHGRKLSSSFTSVAQR